jgi:iron complex outermembrane recepter protein
MVKLAILLALMASPAAAQSISGRVTAASTKQPVANADVMVLDQARSTVMRAPTSGDGLFAFAALRPGNYFLRISVIGYKTSETSVLAVRDTTIRLTIELQDSVLPVSGVTATVAARSRRLEGVGLYERQKDGRGLYLLRDEIEQRHAQRISQLVQGRAGLRVQAVARSNASGITRGDLVMRGGMQASMRSAYCFPRLYLDGVLARPSSTSAPTLTLDELANPADIEAIEIYRSASQLPAEFSGADSSCGVVLIWTRTN